VNLTFAFSLHLIFVILIYLEVMLIAEQSKLSSSFKGKATFAHHVRNFMTVTVATMLLSSFWCKKWGRMESERKERQQMKST